MDTPGTRLGRWLDVFPSGRSPALRDIEMFTGSPVRALAMPANSQPPKRCERVPWLRNCLPAPKGSSYTPFAVKLWRTSMLVLLRSQARQLWFSNDTDSPDPIEESVMP